MYDFDLYQFSNLQKCQDVSVLRKLKILSLKILSSFSPAMNSSIISNGFHDTLSPHQGILPSNTSLPTSVLSLDRMRYLGGQQSFQITNNFLEGNLRGGNSLILFFAEKDTMLNSFEGRVLIVRKKYMLDLVSLS